MTTATISATASAHGLAPSDRAWFGPMLLGGAVFAALMLLGDKLLGDPDTQWHIAVGGRIWADRAVPWLDDYSHTFAGQPWIAKEWLSQLVFYGAHRVAGWSGATALTALALAGLFTALFAWLSDRLRGSLALAFALLAIMLTAPHFLARPHVLALAPFLAWTIGLVGAVESGKPPSRWLLVVVALWANLHGSVTVAYPLAALMAAEAVAFAPAGRRLATARGWAAFGAFALLAGCATPYGVHAMLVTATIFGSGESLPFVTEWQPLALDMTGLVALGLSAALIVALAAEPRRNLFRIAGILGLTLMMARHSRFLDLFALAAPVLAAGPLLRRRPGLGPEPTSRGGPGASRRPIGLTALLALGLGLALTRSPAPAPTVTPAAALAEIRRLGVAGPVYNDYDFGGFLMAEGVPTFIDGRTDQLFLGGFISSLYRSVRAEEAGPFLAIMAERRVSWALVKPGSAEARHLDRGGWRRVHADDVSVAFVRS